MKIDLVYPVHSKLLTDPRITLTKSITTSHQFRRQDQVAVDIDRNLYTTVRRTGYSIEHDITEVVLAPWVGESLAEFPLQTLLAEGWSK